MSREEYYEGTCDMCERYFQKRKLRMVFTPDGRMFYCPDCYAVFLENHPNYQKHTRIHDK